MKKNYHKWLFASSIFTVIIALMIAATIDMIDIPRTYNIDNNKTDIEVVTKELSADKVQAISDVVITNSKQDVRYSGDIAVIFDDVKTISISANKGRNVTLPDLNNLNFLPQGDTLSIDLGQALKEETSYYRVSLTITLPSHITKLTTNLRKLLKYTEVNIIGKKSPQELSISNASNLKVQGDFGNVNILRTGVNGSDYRFEKSTFTNLTLEGDNIRVAFGEVKAKSIHFITDNKSTMRIENMSLLPLIKWEEKATQ